MNKNIVEQAQTDVVEMLAGLSPELYFHNQEHTAGVFDAVTEIGSAMAINENELSIVQIAALFHDTGYLQLYKGHEELSASIAHDYLLKNHVSDAFISEVSSCIFATRMPQHPAAELQEIICDADLKHLATDDYIFQASLLRKEWELVLGRTFTDRQWYLENLQLFSKHTYFTSYAQQHWQKGKEKNRIKITEILGECR